MDGPVDMAIYGNGATALAKDSLITLKGGKIEVPHGKNYAYYTLAAYGGSIYMNMGQDGKSEGNDKVELLGDIYTGKNGNIAIGLTTGGSLWKGIANSMGSVSLSLKNGAAWTNEKQNTPYEDETEDVGSKGKTRLLRLTGGDSKDKAGIIFQKEKKGMNVDNYSGYTQIIYDHDADLAFHAGSVTIESAKEGSSITVKTNNNGIDTGNEEITKKVLNNLAGKLVYENYKKGEKNLTGTVEIAEGITAQGVSVKLGAADFDAKTGVGTYGGQSPVTPPAPGEEERDDAPITDTMTLKRDYTVNADKRDLSNGVIAGVYSNPKWFTEENIIKLAKYMCEAYDKVKAANEAEQAGNTELAKQLRQETGKMFQEIQDKKDLLWEITVDMAYKNLTVNSTVDKDTKADAIGIYTTSEYFDSLVNKFNEMKNEGKLNENEYKKISSMIETEYDTTIRFRLSGMKPDTSIKVRVKNEGDGNAYGIKNRSDKNKQMQVVTSDTDISLDVESRNGDAVGIFDNEGTRYGNYFLRTVSIDKLKADNGQAIGWWIGDNSSANSDIEHIHFGPDIEGKKGSKGIYITTPNKEAGSRIKLDKVSGGFNGNIIEMDAPGSQAEISELAVDMTGHTGYALAVKDGELFSQRASFTGNILIQQDSDTSKPKIAMDNVVNWTGLINNKARDITETGRIGFAGNGVWTYRDVGGASADPEFTGTKIAKLMSVNGTASIVMKETKPLEVLGTYSGATNVFYAHDEKKPETIIGGDFIIHKADPDSLVSLYTDAAGITVSDEKEVHRVLDSLAHKLIYKEATEAGGKKDNLTLLLGIKEGLTSQSVTKEMTVGRFKEEDGRGYLPETIETENPPLRVDKTLTKNTEAVSDVDTALFKKGIIAAISPAGKDLTVDMAGYDLTVTASDTNKKPHMAVAAIYTGKGESVTIKNSKETGMLKLVAEKNNFPGSRYGVWANGDGSHITIDSPVTIEQKGVIPFYSPGGRAASYIVADGENSSVTLNGLVKIVGEKPFEGQNGLDKSVVFESRNPGASIFAKEFDVQVSSALASGNVMLGSGDYNLKEKDPSEVWAQKGTNDKWNLFKDGGRIVMSDFAIGPWQNIRINVEEDGTVGNRRVRLVGGFGEPSNSRIDAGRETPAVRIGLSGEDSYLVQTDNMGIGGSALESGSFMGVYKPVTELYLRNGARLYVTNNTEFSDIHGGKTKETAGSVFIDSTLAGHMLDGHIHVFSNKVNTRKKVLINRAAKGSELVYRVDVSDLPWENDAIRKQNIYDASQSLYYYTHAIGAENLNATIEFTKGDEVLLTEKVHFDDNTGRGSNRYDFEKKAEGKQPSEFYRPIQGGMETDRKTGEITDEYLLSGVLVKPDWYEFRDDAEIKWKNKKRKIDPQTRKPMKDQNGNFIYEDVITNPTRLISIRDKDITIDMAGHILKGNLEKGTRRKAIQVSADNSSLTMKNAGGLDIHLHSQEKASSGEDVRRYANYGIYVGVDFLRTADFSGYTAWDPGYTVHIQNDNDPAHAVRIRGDVEGKKNSQCAYSSVGIYAFNREVTTTNLDKRRPSSVKIDGAVDIAMDNGRGLMANEGIISVGGGKISTPGNYAILAIGSSGSPSSMSSNSVNSAWDGEEGNGVIQKARRGIINVNVISENEEWKPGNNEVRIDGHISTNEQTTIGQWLLGNSETAGIVNLALVTKDSYWKGRAFATTNAVFYAGTEMKPGLQYNGKINLFLKNGATWTNEGDMDYNKPYHTGLESAVNILQGGETDETKGIIYQKYDKKISIRSLRGHTLAYFDRDTEDKTKILGGDIEIGTAVRERNGELASMTLRTDSDGLNMTDEAEVNLVLDNLAKKLIYKGYKEGGRALEGKVEIAEGLTSASAQKSGYIKFDEKTGKGSFSKDKITYTESTFAPLRTSRKLTENASVEAGDRDNVLFYNAALYNAGTDKMEVDLAGHALNLTSTTEEVWTNGAIIKVCDKVPTYFPAGVVGFKNTEIDVKDSSNGKGETHLNVTGFEQQSVYGVVGEENSKVTMAGQTVVDKLNIQSHRNGGGYERAEAAAVLAKGKASRIHLDNLSMKKEATTHVYDFNPYEVPSGKATDANAKKKLLSEYYAYGLVARGEGSEITVGKADLELQGRLVRTEGKGSRVIVESGKLLQVLPERTEKENKEHQEKYGNDPHVMEALDGTIYAGMNQDGNEAGDKTLNVTGNIMARANKGEQGIIHLGLGTKDSSWTGVTDYEYMNGEVNLYLKDGGTWTNERKGNVFEPYHHKGSILKNLKGGAAEKGKGYIIQNDEKPITAETYSGNTTVIYKHDKTDPKKMIGGDFIINKAEKDSMITLRTDNEGMNALSGKKEERNKVSEILNALANKLYYTAYKDGETNLKGKVEIAEGLTAQSASYRLEDMSFKKENGQGQYLFTPATEDIPDTPNPNPNPNPDPDPKPPVIYGPKQTAMMRGAKSAMTTTMLSMRDNMATMTQRLGDIHEGTEDGIWARTYGGKANYNKDQTKTKESFWGVQMGADKKQASGWHTGVSFDYQDGNATYELGGKGDPKLYTLGIYGTKVKDNGEYIDVVAKAGRGQNDYTVYNDMGHKLKGDYKANAMGLSVEYGKRIEKGDKYLTPQIQLSYMKLQGTDYDAISDYAGGKKMHVEQDGMTSLVGRIGIAAGKRTDKTDLYLKANLLHEFKGTTASTFSAENEPTATVDQDFGDTWAEISIGVNHNIDKDKMVYADITKSFGGDYEMEWKANAGIRLRF